VLAASLFFFLFFFAVEVPGEREREERTFLPWPRVNPLLVKVT
jgi:hypothetical protein